MSAPPRSFSTRSRVSRSGKPAAGRCLSRGAPLLGDLSLGDLSLGGLDKTGFRFSLWTYLDYLG